MVDVKTMTAKKVLLVEDHSSVALVLEVALTSLGEDISVLTVHTGEEAQKSIASGDWDMVIADYSLPGISGLDLIRRIKAEVGRSVSWILITAYGDQDIRDKAVSLGVAAYLPKPFSIEEFRRTVSSQLDFPKSAMAV